ncbi:MAG: oxidoreductase, partial [Euryarchaeota archaeon]|nr:oxidoreductase [Euryarchaeota archaeon]
METGLAGKVVLVTGGAGGIGQSICRAFSSEGARVVVHYHESEESAIELAEELGGVAMGADLRDPLAASGLISDVISELGSLDVC